MHRAIRLSPWRAVFALGACFAGAACFAADRPAAPACPEHAARLKLPAGFCATIFADKVGHARHMVVGPNGVLYVNTWSGRYYPHDSVPAGGFLLALQDTKGNGHADVIRRFGETLASGGAGGTGIGLYKGYLYAEINDRIVRYKLDANSIVPTDKPEVVVSGLPLGGDHPMHPFAIDADGMMYVDVASASNACQKENRVLRSPGVDPCVELETRGGIWRYDANKLNQKFSPAERFATGIRNADGIAIDPSGHGVYATQHGRDQLGQNWPELYTAEQGAILPSEVLLHVTQGGDYGWPECYYDPLQAKLVLAPEYGGDGGKKLGVCADKQGPVAAFPAHWAPDDLLLYAGKDFPSRYSSGAFLAFHGSWNRAPYEQGGYNIVFQPLHGGAAAGQCEIFADGFAGGHMDPGKADHRPTGLALAPGGVLYVSDDQHGRIYRIAFTGDPAQVGTGTRLAPCPSANATAGKLAVVPSEPPEGTNPDAAAIKLPAGVTPQMVALGAKIFKGQVGSAACTGCHGTDGSGTPLGPNLVDHKWLWSDGSVNGIRKTITEGVATPKEYRSPMPAMGGAQLTSDQLEAVAAYVWTLSHPAAH
ncbi:MAG TPA: c-type cytochrome [Steroidobacteraceae bacterium]|nr:c-type cytochrome [Steroidobacteraceae bacterium]